MQFNLPRKYLSHSAISLWERSKDDFRRRYYLGEKLPDSAYALFGREVHERIENKEVDLPQTFTKCEHEIKIAVTIEDVPVLGYIDLMRKKDGFFADVKTGIRKQDGSPRWTGLDVEKHDQLPFYSMLIEEKYGVVNPYCNLLWLESRWKPEKHTLGDSEMWTEGNELELTGHWEMFTRYIYPRERERIKSKIAQAAHEISEDYTLWQTNNNKK